MKDNGQADKAERKKCEHLLAFLRDLNRCRDLDSLAQAILEHAIALVPQAQSGSFLVLNEEEGVFEYRAAVGWDLARLSRIKIPKDCIVQRK